MSSSRFVFLIKSITTLSLTVWSHRGGLGGVLPAYASPMPCEPSRGDPAGEAYILSREPFSRLTAIQLDTYTEAIPKRRPFGIALFLPIFIIPFSIQIGFRYVCADAIFGIRVEGEGCCNQRNKNASIRPPRVPSLCNSTNN